MEAEGDPDDGDAAEDTRAKVTQSQLPTKENCPKQIGNGVLFVVGLDIFSKGSKGQLCRLEALMAEGNAENGDAKQDAQQHPREPQPKAAEDKPKNVSNQTHDNSPFDECRSNGLHPSVVLLYHKRGKIAIPAADLSEDAEKRVDDDRPDYKIDEDPKRHASELVGDQAVDVILRHAYGAVYFGRFATPQDLVARHEKRLQKSRRREGRKGAYEEI